MESVFLAKFSIFSILEIGPKKPKGVNKTKGRFLEKEIFGLFLIYICRRFNNFDNFRTCESDRQWSGSHPECKEINCGAPGGGHLPNGWLEGSR